LLGKLEGRKQLGDNIRIDLGEIEWRVVGWIHLAQDGDQWQVLVNTVMDIRVP